MNIKKLGLPKGFLIGTGTSSIQCEGQNTNNDWYQWEQKGLMPAIGIAANFWDNYKEWVDKAAQVGNVFRLSLEWSRIEPAKGRFDENTLHRYREMLLYCKEKGLKTVVTLHHFSNPIWIAKKGGWLNPEIEDRFQIYAGVCAIHFADLVDYWITINEPQIYVGARMGAWPEKYNIKRALTVLFKRMTNAHCKAYEIIHAWYPSAKVGTAQNIQYFHGKNVGKLVTKLADAVWNFGFLDRTIDTHDFIGVNYYGRIDFPLENPANVLANLKPDAEGLKHVLKKLQKYSKPILITENGLPTAEGIFDDDRYKFIVAHLSVISQNLESGTNVVGYIYWSLMDTYEIQGAYNIFMGLFTRDGNPKNSAKLMQNLLSESKFG